jgi:hypothetical protein
VLGANEELWQVEWVRGLDTSQLIPNPLYLPNVFATSQETRVSIECVAYNFVRSEAVFLIR